MATIASADNCDSCGQLEWLCICEPNCVSCDKVDYLCKCEPIEAKEEQRNNYCNSCGSWCCVSCKLTPKLHATSCEDCESAATVKLEPYGSSFQAVIVCPKCGVSYDTNLDPADIEALR